MSVRIRWNEKHGAYSLWDSEIGWVDKFGRASDSYYCETRDVAIMRRRDLNQYRKDLEATRKPTESDSETLGEALTLDDVIRLEEAADALSRAAGRKDADGSEYGHAIALWALALKVRWSFKIPPWERAER